MGRKRRDMTCLRPFCFYCDKSFKNEVILHHHQKAKHFSCPRCPKKFSSIDSMVQHCRSQHNETIQRVPNANTGRDHPGLKIFGMQGVPRIQIQAWISKQANKYWGKRIEKKLQAHRKEMELKKQQEKLNEIPQQKEEEQMEPQPQQNMDFPLELKFGE